MMFLCQKVNWVLDVNGGSLMKADSNIHIRISEELKETFTELCKNNKQTTSSVIKRFIREYVRKKGEIRYE
jgi:endonuclease III-like uncharacterized protein